MNVKANGFRSEYNDLPCSVKLIYNIIARATIAYITHIAIVPIKALYFNFLVY